VRFSLTAIISGVCIKLLSDLRLSLSCMLLMMMMLLLLTMKRPKPLVQPEKVALKNRSFGQH